MNDTPNSLREQLTSRVAAAREAVGREIAGPATNAPQDPVPLPAAQRTL
ncbi:hypothetical protein ACWCPM_07760 [Streptomyces sp. NPDC002309]